MIENSTRTAVESDLNKHHSKYEDPLWNESEEASKTLIHVKLKKTSSKCIWNVFSNKVLVFAINGALLTKKDLKFLLTLEGSQFIIQSYKDGCNSMNKFRVLLKGRHD